MNVSTAFCTASGCDSRNWAKYADHQIAEKCRRIFGHLPRGRRRDRTADAEKGAVMRIKVASGGLLTDIAPTRIIPIGVIGFWIGILMRKAERILVP